MMATKEEGNTTKNIKTKNGQNHSMNKMTTFGLLGATKISII